MIAVQGQLDIFTFLNDSDAPSTCGYCWDSDINEIHNKLVNLATKYRLDVKSDKWEIWEHVPQYGYRMTFEILIGKDDYTDQFLTELNTIADFAKSRNVELSPTAPMFLGDNRGNMYIFSTFLDKARQKRK